MSVLNDKILRGGEITISGKQKNIPLAFYLMLIPKNEAAPTVAILNVKLSEEKSFKDFPFMVGQWNPVVVNDVDVKETDLTNYRIFYGIE